MQIKKLALAFLLLCSSMQSYAQIEIGGLDLNPALLGCLLSRGDCLGQTGIPIVDLIFGGAPTPHHTDESFCYAYLHSWCSGPAGYPSAYKQCREAKKSFYKKAKIQMGEWPDFYDNQSRRESAYFDELEKHKKVDFTCTPRQKFLWLKNRCSHTQRYKHYTVQQTDYSADVWARIKTDRCD